MSENQNNTRLPADEIDQMEEYREWLNFAQTDYNCAAYLNQSPFHPRPLNVICYHCQQAAEKAIKALIVFLAVMEECPRRMISLSF